MKYNNTKAKQRDDNHQRLHPLLLLIQLDVVLTFYLTSSFIRLQNYGIFPIGTITQNRYSTELCYCIQMKEV
ncbi:MAG TPA: hypothetical protein DEQ84_07170 [Prevotellaceae bacterium]|nr:hypothetical protein [Prevotellaceae bacterium]